MPKLILFTKITIMEKNYLFIQDMQENYDLSCLDFTDIHIWHFGSVHHKKKNQNVYFYTKNLYEFNYVLKSENIPHITFVGDTLFSDFYKQTLLPEFCTLERFWFPEEKHLNQKHIDMFMNLCQIENTSIAVVFNPNVQKDITYQEFYNFIQLLYSQYLSPLFKKDLDMYEEEIFSVKNMAIINGKSHYVVLGLFGDYYLPDLPTNQAINFGILKDSQCVMCDFANACKQRGLGIIKHSEQIKLCIGIKSYNQN